MDFYNFFKSFLGIPNSVPPHDFNSDRYDNYEQNGHDNLFRGDTEEEEGMGFHIFSSPLEMQRFFEQQINEVIRSFGMHEEGSFFGDFFNGRNTPAIEPQNPSTNLRDQYLKPGFETPTTSKNKSDTDVDGKVTMNDLDTVLKGENNITPYQRPSQRQRSSFFGQSVTSRTVVKPDGTVESHRTVKDNAGNEETTVTCKRGDQEYTVITRTDKDGKQEREEKMVNIDENEVGALKPSEPTQGSGLLFFDFNQFFK